MHSIDSHRPLILVVDDAPESIEPIVDCLHHADFRTRIATNGERALRLPAKAAPEAAVRVVRRFSEEREAGETFRTWIDRSGGVKAVAEGLKDLDVFPTFEENPGFYVDYGETGPYVAEVGESECAT